MLMLRTGLVYHKHSINVGYLHHHLGSISHKGERYLTIIKVIQNLLRSFTYISLES